jgi:hypothetical protein
MKIIIAVLLSIGLCEYAEASEAFCLAWASDAAQGAEKRLQGVEYDRIEALINELPDEILPREGKDRAISAVRWAYYFHLDMQTAHQIGNQRCLACVDQKNPRPCLDKFDQALKSAMQADNEIQF